MSNSIVDDVNKVVESAEIKNSELVSKFTQALEKIQKLQDEGIIKPRGNTLLPIEDRYRSIYINKDLLLKSSTK